MAYRVYPVATAQQPRIAYLAKVAHRQGPATQVAVVVAVATEVAVAYSPIPLATPAFRVKQAVAMAAGKPAWAVAKVEPLAMLGLPSLQVS
jgi:hypothetical protein